MSCRILAPPPRLTRIVATFPSISSMGPKNWLRWLLADDGQDVAEYAVMLFVVLVIVVGTIQVIGLRTGHVFSDVISSLH